MTTTSAARDQQDQEQDIDVDVYGAGVLRLAGPRPDPVEQRRLGQRVRCGRRGEHQEDEDQHELERGQREPGLKHEAEQDEARAGGIGHARRVGAG